MRASTRISEAHLGNELNLEFEAKMNSQTVETREEGLTTRLLRN